MIQTQQNKYLETAIQSASPAQLLIMLCDGAIRFCKQSIEALKVKNYEEANRNIIKVQDIIKEFVITLDNKAPIAANLLAIYDYMERRLIEANIYKLLEPVEEVLGYLQELRTTWFEANKLASSGKSSDFKHG
jgi:flagellar protein FliS